MARILFLISLSFYFYSAACLKVGVIGEFTTPTGSLNQPFGNEILRGVEVAQEVLIKQGGKSNCVTLTKIDISNSLANIPGNIQEAVKKGINIFIGLGTSDQVRVSLDTLEKTKSVLFSPTASLDSLVEDSNRIIMMFPRNSEISSSLAKISFKNGLRNVIGVFAGNIAYSKSFYEYFKNEFEKKGGTLVGVEVRAGNIDGSGLVDLIKKTPNYDALFLPLFELDVAKVISEVNSKVGLKQVIGTDSWGTYSSVIANLSKNIKINGFRPEIYSPLDKSSSNVNFIKLYKQKYNTVPTDLSAFSFDSLVLALKMSQKCSKDIIKWNPVKCLSSSLPFLSVTGPISKHYKTAILRDLRVAPIKIKIKENL